MATRVEASLPLLVISAALILLSFTSSVTVSATKTKKTWCVAKPSSDNATLLDNISYACTNVDCSILQQECCSEPNNLMSHASIAMNLYYQAAGRNDWNCDFKNSALIVVSDPSFGECTYA